MSTNTMTTTYTLNTISCSSRYPPQAYTPTKKEDRICTKCKNKILTVQAHDVKDIPHHVVQQLHPDKPELQDKFIVVEDKPNSWILTVPLEINDNEVIYVKMFGDSGADCNGIDENWAIAEFDDKIQTTTQTAAIDTPGGIIESNKFVNLSFKRHDNVKWTTRFYLLPNLPLELLGGKNLLESFGFVFPHGVPEIFKHPEELEIDMELELNETFKPIEYKNSNKMYLLCKSSKNELLSESTTMMNKLFVGTKTIQDYSKNNNNNITSNYYNEKKQRKMFNTCKLYNLSKSAPQDNDTTTSRLQPANAKNSNLQKPQDTNNKNDQTPLTNKQQQNKLDSIQKE